MYPVEAVLVEVAVDRHRQAVADPGHGAEGVRARPQVGHLAEVLEGVPLGRDGIGVRIVHPADHDHRVRDKLHGLPLALRGGNRARDPHGAAGGQVQDLVLVVAERGRGHDLQRVEAGPVVHLQEREAGLRIAARPNPALDGGRRADDRPAREDIDDAVCLRHVALLPASRSTLGRTVLVETVGDVTRSG